MTTLDGTDYPGGIIFQAVVKLFERTWELRLPDCKNKHPSFDLKMITLQPNALYQGSQRMRSAFLVEPSTVMFVQGERRSRDSHAGIASKLRRCFDLEQLKCIRGQHEY